MTTIDDGGPAFPVPDFTYPSGQTQYGTQGMSLRDWFAGQALPAIIQEIGRDAHHCAKEAYHHADAMMEARKPKP